ncbi:hypothetical protein [Emticicia sp. C21]|uniref:hypothetical protein n=1 Tax=Emticicia sp. C21 TaxID=2302915 RepID=UPI000E35214E|nr:hypothetical protein [Emticicia sp. C21]RFS16847.1 hypothetical protein D0T08_09205 [Emticicia sp. C21]
MNATDILIVVSIHLFVLSIINEKFTSFLKLNLQSLYENDRDFWIIKVIIWRSSKRRKFRKFLRRNLKNFRNHEADDGKEKLRERGVINLTIFCGIVTAAFAGADLFHLLKNADNEQAIVLLDWTGFLNKLHWNWRAPWEILGPIGNAISKHSFGIIFSGLFLSLGSKFWHDLLDMLFEAKRLRSKLNNNEVFESRSMAEVEEFINADIAQLATQQLSVKYNKKENVLYIGPALRRIDGISQEVLLIYLTDDDDSQIARQERVLLPSGRVINIKTMIVKGLTRPKASTAIEEHLRQADIPDIFGTACCILTPKLFNTRVRFLLTCNHLFTQKAIVNQGGWIENPEVDVLLGDENIGKWSYGVLDKDFDMALVELNEGIEIVGPNLTSKSRQIGGNDVNTKVIMLGANSKEKTGFIKGVLRQNLRIEYNDKTHEIGELIEIANSTSENHNSISDEGDSGAIIYDAKDRTPLGMVIAFNNRFTYAISMHKILKELEMNVLPTNLA